MKRIVCMIICMMVFYAANGVVFAEQGITYHVVSRSDGFDIVGDAGAMPFYYGTMIIDGKKIETPYTVAFNDIYNTLHVPLRALLEGLGAEVKWDAETGNISAIWPEQEYLFDMSAEWDSLRNVKNVTKDEYLSIFSFGFNDVDGRIYLYQDTAKELLQEFASFIQINQKEHILYIRSKEAGWDETKEGTLLIDGELALLNHPVIFSRGRAYLNMGEVWERLGGTVRWTANHRYVYLTGLEGGMQVYDFYPDNSMNSEKYLRYGVHPIRDQYLEGDKEFLADWLENEGLYTSDEIPAGFYLPEERFVMLRRAGYSVSVDWSRRSISIKRCTCGGEDGKYCGDDPTSCSRNMPMFLHQSLSYSYLYQ